MGWSASNGIIGNSLALKALPDKLAEGVENLSYTDKHGRIERRDARVRKAFSALENKTDR